MTAAQRRRAAATLRMIDALPETGALVVVHAHSAIAPVRDLIARRRGADVAGGIRVVAAPSELDERAIAAGTDLPIVREPFVRETCDHALALLDARGFGRPAVRARRRPPPA